MYHLIQLVFCPSHRTGARPPTSTWLCWCVCVVFCRGVIVQWDRKPMHHRDNSGNNNRHHRCVDDGDDAVVVVIPCFLGGSISRLVVFAHIVLSTAAICDEAAGGPRHSCLFLCLCCSRTARALHIRLWRKTGNSKPFSKLSAFLRWWEGTWMLSKAASSSSRADS
ncbi:hypothetical protein GGS23DRAFT_61878 [Durotheca rogersii]|uniref:uncharacterized protein n=1 Tax=Durotheca rogersii TaxID=419775 RepID=UPI00221EB81E|nr:uncharacterized protein GGS23DRAFT_61878 [Durotheca rogersii]KAI5863272.1 hypothetical protein GGS23DRAFT_61878 [Durotheca rogersii]